MLFPQLCEGFRPDIDILSVEVMSWEWYNSRQGVLFKNITFPGYVYHPYKYAQRLSAWSPLVFWNVYYRQGAYSMKQFLEANLPHRKIYLAGEWKVWIAGIWVFFFLTFTFLWRLVIPPLKATLTYYRIIKFSPMLILHASIEHTAYLSGSDRPTEFYHLIWLSSKDLGLCHRL